MDRPISICLCSLHQVLLSYQTDIPTMTTVAVILLTLCAVGVVKAGPVSEPDLMIGPSGPCTLHDGTEVPVHSSSFLFLLCVTFGNVLYCGESCRIQY